MIKQIAKLEHIGKFTSFTQEKEFAPDEQKCNIIFGFNGSGKTTLSNAISFFADNSFINETEKMEIFGNMANAEQAIVELELECKSNCKYPASNLHNKNIYVFNSNFVVSHVFDGTKGNMKGFNNAVDIENPVITELNNKIDKLKAEKNNLENENIDLEKQLKNINQMNSSNFNKIFTDGRKQLNMPNLHRRTLPSESIDELQQTLSRLVSDYKLSIRHDDLDKDLNSLKQLSFLKCNLNLNKVNAVLNKNVQQLSKEILENKINEIKELLIDESHKQRVEGWFQFGKNILDSVKDRSEKTKCPICDTDISDRLDLILQNFNGYFDKGYEDLITGLKACQIQIKNATDLMEQCERNICALEKFYEKYKVQITVNNIPAYEFKGLIEELRVLSKACETKLNNIQSTFQIQQSTVNSLLTTNNSIERISDFKKTLHAALDSKKLNRDNIEKDIRSTYEKMTLLQFNQLDGCSNFAKYINNQNRIQIISTPESTNQEGLLFYQNKLREELKKIKIESAFIVKYLKIMGIDHFIVEINEDAPDENIIIKYKSRGIDKKKLKNCLSDGEKTALAFAYFLSKFENERDTGEKRKSSIVVIDDPISSLDENRLYSTAHLIWDNFKSIKQLIVLSHNFLFLKFFNSFYGGNANCFFLNDNKLSDLPEELKNFESQYFYMLKSVIMFTDRADTDFYQEAKKYLPNYIRRVLETFLSFKFAKIVSKQDEHRSPGLRELNKCISNLSVNDSIKEEIKLKISDIIKITNTHSHGNAQLMEENFYIAENELKKMAQDAVYIMDTLDNIHINNLVRSN